MFNQTSLRRTLASYFDYYHRSRTHLSLDKDSPEPRPIQPPELGRVVAVSQVGGLHHRYERANRAILALARKLVAYLVAIDRRQEGFLVVEKEDRAAA